ncbi:MAG: Type 1 glutamine amidotransferase-like domain-containing protein [Pseudonocardiaceae bacterium]
MPADRLTILATSMGFNRARDPWQPSPIFRYAFDLAGRPSCPKLCFLTTGTGDRQTSIGSFYAAFADSGVDASHLSLFDKPNVKDVSAHLRKQDVIWVDRGSLANLLAVWRMHALGKVLRVRCDHSRTG